jgi:hypothetical protein
LKRRIVANVENLMKLCDDLEAKMRRPKQTAEKLFEAGVAEMVSAAESAMSRQQNWKLAPSWIGLLLWALTVAACLPIPHSEIDAARVSGVARQQGQPLAGVVLHRHVGRAPPDPCSGGELSTTDAGGRFSFNAVSHREPVILFGDRMPFWEVGFALPSGVCVAWKSYASSFSGDVECAIGPAPPDGTKLVTIESARSALPPDQGGCWVVVPSQRR